MSSAHFTKNFLEAIATPMISIIMISVRLVKFAISSDGSDTIRRAIFKENELISGGMKKFEKTKCKRNE